MKDLNQKLKRWGLGILAGSILLSSSVSSFAQSPADPKKVLRYVFPVAETGFDPAGVHDLYSAMSMVRFLKLCLPMIIWPHLRNWCHEQLRLYPR